ncbi:MAG: ribonuclease HII [Pseudomonadales bacterium]|nr:ribonuclease HII [Pseudomonadales bacterium]
MSSFKPTAPTLSYRGEWLAGVDEVGRGPLAGDVVAAAVILDPQQPIEGLADSKKISAARREKLFLEIMSRAHCVAIGRASVAEIDRINILHASLLAMHRAVQGLASTPEFVLVDGNRLPDWSYPAQAVVKGDALFDCISAASIIAKVTRDREMQALATRFPEYGFEQHKGYPTARHISALQEHGACEVHRESFAPVRAVNRRSAHC